MCVAVGHVAVILVGHNHSYGFNIDNEISLFLPFPYTKCTCLGENIHPASIQGLIWPSMHVGFSQMTTDKDKRPPRMRTPDIDRVTGSSDESVANSRAASPDDDMLGPTAAGEVSHLSIC
jgi:hypothetical protein